MIKIIATLNQTEEGIRFELEQNGIDVKPLEDFLSEALAKVIQTHINELIDKMFGEKSTKHILN